MQVYHQEVATPSSRTTSGTKRMESLFTQWTSRGQCSTSCSCLSFCSPRSTESNLSLEPLRTVSCPQKESLKLRSRYYVNGRCLVMAFRTHYPPKWNLALSILSWRNWRQQQKKQGHSCFSKVCAKSLSRVRLFATLFLTRAHQGPLSMGFSRQEYWSRLPFPPPVDLSDPGIETVPPVAPELTSGFLTC